MAKGRKSKGRLEMNANALKEIFSSAIYDRYFLIVLGIFFFSLYIRLKYAFLSGMWVDEGRYAVIGRALLEHPFSYSTRMHGTITSFPPLFPFLLFISQLIFGAGEFAVRIVNPFLGALSVVATYYLARHLFNKQVGVISALLMSVAPYNLFFSERVLLEIPHLLFFTLTIAFFYVGWEKKKERYLYVSAVFLALGALTKQPGLIAGLVIFSYLVVFYRFDWIKHKNLWKAALIFFLVMTPWSLRSLNACGKPFCEASFAISWFKTEGGGLDVVHDYFYYIKLMPWLFNTSVFLAFLVGIALSLRQRKQTTLLLLWFFWIMFVFSITAVKVPRYVISVIVPAVILASNGIFEIARQISKDNHIRAGVMIILALLLAYFSYGQGVSMIVSKAPAFLKLKDAGLFFENLPDDTIILSATPQIIAFYGGDKKVVPYPQDKNVFAKYIYEHNVSYVVLDAYERTQPNWTFEYVPQQSYLVPVKAFSQNGRTVVVIFEVNRSALREEIEKTEAGSVA